MRASQAILLLASMCFMPVVVSGQSAALTIEITNIRFEKGWIRLGLYNHQDQFPVNPSRTFDFKKTSLKKGMMEIIQDQDRNTIFKKKDIVFQNL